MHTSLLHSPEALLMGATFITDRGQVGTSAVWAPQIKIGYFDKTVQAKERRRPIHDVNAQYTIIRLLLNIQLHAPK